METKLQNNRTRTKEVTLECKHIFSQDELSALMMEMAEANYEAERAEDEKKEVVAQYKARIETHESRRKSAGGKIRAGYELRPTACRQVVDYDKGTVTIYRLDTNMIISERNLTPAESQITMSFEDGMEAGQGGFWPTEEVQAEVVDESTGEVQEEQPAGMGTETEPVDQEAGEETGDDGRHLQLVDDEAGEHEEDAPEETEEETHFGPKSCPGCDEMLKNHESGECPVCGMQINTD